MRLIILSCFFLTYLSACSVFEKKIVQKPDVSIQSVYVKDPQLLSATLVFVFNIKNPNKISMNVEKINYDIALSGKPFTNASAEPKTKIPAQGEGTVELPLPIQYSKVLEGLADIAAGKDLDYTISGKATISGFTIPFKEDGKVSLKK